MFVNCTSHSELLSNAQRQKHCSGHGKNLAKFGAPRKKMEPVLP